MLKILKSDKDAYITNRLIRGTRVTGSNVGDAGTLDLFKLYGYTHSGTVPNVELSRLLIRFNIDDVVSMHQDGLIDITSNSFNATLKLFDVYGGQTVPSNFTVVVNPLSATFDEGLGRDVAYYSDRDACNYMSASDNTPWLIQGCGLGGGLPGTVDYITASTNAPGVTFETTQTFIDGTEDLSVDVTAALSATIAGVLPNEGFRIALSSNAESDAHSYFVKRFASRTAYNSDKRPQLVVKFDDSIQDDSLNAYTNSNMTLFMYNYVNNVLVNVVSGSSMTPLTGSNCIGLRMLTAISGGWYALPFTGSQHRIGSLYVTGVYSASVNINPYDSVVASKLAASGSVDFVPVWGSLDTTVPLLTGSIVKFRNPNRTSTYGSMKSWTVSVHDIDESYTSNDNPTFRVSIIDHSIAATSVVRLPIDSPGIVVRDLHYQVRDSITGNIIIPYDTTYNSTRVSSDDRGMYFNIDMSNLTVDRSYVIDVVIIAGRSIVTHKNVSPVFRVVTNVGR